MNQKLYIKIDINLFMLFNFDFIKVVNNIFAKRINMKLYIKIDTVTHRFKSHYHSKLKVVPHNIKFNLKK